MTVSPVLVVGLDGADFRYLDQFADSLPHLSRLRDEGVDWPLESTHPPWTGSAWPSMYTGTDPSHHGVYDFFDYRNAYPDEATVNTRNEVRAPAIWNYLTEVGLRSVILNVPVTHPAEELDGVLIPGYLAPADEKGYPENIRDRLSEELGASYNIYSNHETEGATTQKIDGYAALIETRATAAAHLLETEEWDFAMVQVQKTDAVFHNSSSTDDFRRIYRAADDLIGRVVDACETTPNVVICSDHGMGPVTGYAVCVNELLREHGFVQPTTDTTDRSLTGAKAVTEEGDARGGGEPHAAFEVLNRIAHRVGVRPGSAYRLARKLGVEDQVLQLVPQGMKQSMIRGVDWVESMAYCRRGSEQGIRINLEGREPDGVVPKDQYDAVREEIVRVLSSLKTEDGDPIFEFVRRREEMYEGPYTEDACDILFRTAGMNHKILTKLYGVTLIPTDSHSHKATGVFIASGPDVNDEWRGDALSLVDVAAVVFSLLGQPVPNRMTGAVPEGLTSTPPQTRAYGNIPFGGTPSYSQDQAEVTERLSDLGYL
jgi:predicted AlkP superfamily phosphohydrolase/phosphomutase